MRTCRPASPAFDAALVPVVAFSTHGKQPRGGRAQALDIARRKYDCVSGVLRQRTAASAAGAGMRGSATPRRAHARWRRRLRTRTRRQCAAPPSTAQAPSAAGTAWTAEIEIGIGLGGVQRGGEQAVLHLQHDFGEPGDAGCRFKMPHVGFDRAEGAEAAIDVSASKACVSAVTSIGSPRCAPVPCASMVVTARAFRFRRCRARRG